MRSLRFLVIVALVATAAWYWFAPRRAYENFVHAVAFGDADGLEETIDFPVLRMNLREDIQAGLRRSGGSNLGTTITGAFMGSLVDAAVAPEGLSQILTSFGTRDMTNTDAESPTERATTSFRYRSPSSVDVILHPAGKPDERGGILTFGRKGMRWKLTRARGGNQ